MNLPDPCAECLPFGGLWIKAGNGGLERCSCERGLALAENLKSRLLAEHHPPVVSTEHALVCAGMIATLPFFPMATGSRALVAHEISAMCRTDEEAVWLATKVVRLYDRWPGVIELRRVYCATHFPLDGLEAIGESPFYPDGIPSDRPPDKERERLEAPPSREMISAAESIREAVSDMANAKNMNNVRKPMKEPREIPVIRITDANRITEEDIRLAEIKYREEKARQEMGYGLATAEGL